MNESYEIAVIGSGGAGAMAYLRAVLNCDRTILFAGDSTTKRKGRATWVVEVDNIPGMHGVKRPIISVVNSTLRWVDADENLRDRGTVVKNAVARVEKRQNDFILHYQDKDEQKTISAKHVILATGIMDVQPEINGSIEPIFPFANQGDLLYCVRCDGHKTIGKKLSIIGLNDIAIHIGVLMVERYGHKDVSILTNGMDAQFSDHAHDLAKKFNLLFFDEPIVSILKDSKSNRLKGYEFKKGHVETNCTIVALGIIPYNQLLKDLHGELDLKGKAIVSEKYESSVENFFVVGDLVSGKKMQIYTAWDQAVDAADEINKRLRLAKRKNH